MISKWKDFRNVGSVVKQESVLDIFPSKGLSIVKIGLMVSPQPNLFLLATQIGERFNFCHANSLPVMWVIYSGAR